VPKKRKEIRAVGRPLLYPVKILLPLAAETLVEIDGAVQPDETRLDLIREAIERELSRRMRLWSQRNLTRDKRKRDDNK
jgi:hypothetical protein